MIVLNDRIQINLVKQLIIWYLIRMSLAGAVQQMKTQLWQKLEVIFNNYASSNKAEIPTSRVEQIIHDALGEQTPQEIDYVVKNMFRLDSDSSGTVSFEEFGNFLFKRHCGEMSLQKMHMQNQMSHGAQRKITDEEFYQLINRAYKFLQVKVHHQVTSHIFSEVDTDRDGLISYVEYFEVINRYICKSAKEKASKPIQMDGKERNSRLRSWMWIQLRKLYESYIHGRYLSASDKELRGLICSIVGDLSESEMSSLLSQLFLTQMRFIEFEPFASVFLYLIAELRLSRYSRYHNLTQKTLSKDEFTTLFKNTYQFLSLGRVRASFIDLLYKNIDQNHDGVVSYDQYLDWVKRFIAVPKYFGDEFYFKQDDIDLDSREDWLFDPERKPVENRTIAQKIKFVFKDHTLAYAVRERMYSLLIEFDRNRDELFDQSEIQNALRKLLKENENELKYVTGNVFRYDRDGDRNVTDEQFTNFCVEQHFGEMAIQRLHKRKFYSKGSERMMNLEEFGKTLNFCLGFINIEATNEQVHTLFNQIDLDHDGWVSYEVYFFFLKYYFGSLSLAAQQPRIKIEHKAGTLQKDIAIMSNMVNLSAIQKLVKLINSQLQEFCARYDVNRNMVYEPEQIQAILTQVFLLTPTQIDYIMYNYFRFDIRNHNSATYTQFISIVLEIFFIEILFNRIMRKDNSEGRTSDNSELGSIHKSQSLNNHRISIREFMDFMDRNLFFIRLKPTPFDLLEVFQTLDTDKDGFISFQQYIAFIRHFLGRGLEIVDQPIKTQPLKPQPVTEGITPEELQFVDQIWTQLKKYFDKYDTTHKSYLKESQLKSFAVEVLHETSQRELDYIFWNLFRVDDNYNHQVDFEEFAPFVLKHAAQISLQRFHREQVKGSNSLNEDQLYFVLNGAYSFLLSMPRNKLAVSNIFRRISKNGSIPYGLFLSWVNEAIAKRYR